MPYKGHLSYSIVERAKVRHRALHHHFPGIVPELLRVGVRFTSKEPDTVENQDWAPHRGAINLPCKYGQVPAWIVVRKPTGTSRGGKFVIMAEILVAVPGDAQCMFLWRYWNDNQFEFVNNFAQSIKGR